MNLLRFIRTGLILTGILFVPAVSANQMLLDRMVVYFEPGQQPRQDIRVTNVGQDNLYLQTEVYKVMNPGEKNEELIRVVDPDKMKLLTTPQKSIVRPKGQRSVRLVNLETPKDKESVYRITFRPVTAQVKSENEQNAIQLLVAYQALVFIKPEKPVYKVVAKRVNNEVVFTNSGNSNVVLRNGEQCLTVAKEAECRDIPDIGRIYAGQSIALDLPGKEKHVKFGVYDGSEEKQQVFTL